ncbi:putative AAP1-alanine/arginine aminopeptidase [Rhodotorula sp. JG-1b]|nr:putative AAP1-alanine/arginine aminopeptidase [Rhodotorula sp. JG-1b]
MHHAHETDTRLPLDVVPSHYDFTIRTDLKQLTFTGTAEITISVHKAIPHIVIHVASPLVLEAAVLGLSENGSVARAAECIRVEKKTLRAYIRFKGGEVPKGEYKLGLRWRGVLDDSLSGYYRSSSPKKDGEGTVYSGITQFEPCHARQALPCFDEPALKATFSVSLISRTGTISLANTDVKSVQYLGQGGAFPRTALLTENFFATETEKETVADSFASPNEQAAEAESKIEQDEADFRDDWEITHFHPTPKMSTYLLAWANGAFEHIEASYRSPLTGREVPLRIYATWDQIGQAQLSLDTTVKILPIYEEIFDIEYPLTKLDTLVASDFQGAMENWGLIIGQTTAYLWDPKKSGLKAKKLVVSIQSHEVAHQWFGNVVTMEWWDNLWLNESFATLMGEVIIPDRIEPSWRVHSAFITAHLARALSLDALRSSHPIEMPCPDEDTIQQIFDALTYSKGASCLKMLSNFVGEEKFLKGVSIYLKEHLYGNARTQDLMAGISEASGQDVGKMMDNWLSKTGFPLITVEETEKGLKVRQNRFFATADATPEEDQTLWHVPLQLLVVDLKTGKSKVHSELVLSERETTIEIEDVANTTYKLNAETCGVYRTLYPTSRLAKLGSEAGKGNTSKFSLNDRMGLVQDASVVASSGYAKTSGSLTLLSQMKGEEENLVWQEIATALGSIVSTWWEQPEEVRDAISKFRRELFKPVAQRLGFDFKESDDADTTELRSTAISVLAAAGDEETLAEYRRRFGAFMEKNDDSEIPGDLKTSIYAQSVRFGGEKVYEKVVEVYQNPPTPAHKSSAIVALCSAEKPELVDRTIKMMMTGDVKNQDMGSFVAYLGRNRAAKRKIWECFQQNYDAIMLRFKGNFSIGNIVKYSFMSLTSEKDAQQVEAFFKDKDTSAFDQGLSQGLDAVRAKAKWLERDTKDVEQWLRDNKYLQ